MVGGGGGGLNGSIRFARLQRSVILHAETIKTTTQSLNTSKWGGGYELGLESEKDPGSNLSSIVWPWGKWLYFGASVALWLVIIPTVPGLTEP